jgi:exodeoxyribonuclease X
MTVLRVIDFETTGMGPPAEVCEVGICDLTQLADGSWEVGEPDSWLCGVAAIPPEVRAVHHITMDDVNGAAPFDPTALVEDASDCALLAAHNVQFEASFMPEAIGVMHFLCTYKAALRVWPDAPSHSNGALRYWLEDQGLITGLDPKLAQPSHRAGPDAYVTAHILRALLGLATGRDMVAWTDQPRLLPKITFGKHKGSQWSEAPADYLEWVANKSDLDADTKWNAARELQRRRAA